MHYTSELPPIVGYVPHRWILLRYHNEYAILAGSTNDWRRSSAIQNVVKLDNGFGVTTQSGSRYHLNIENFGLSLMTADILSLLENSKNVEPILVQEQAERILDVDFR